MNPKLRYETLETEYEGESGAPWVAFLAEKQAKGWEMRMAEVTDRITDTRFRGRVKFRRPVTP